MQPPLIDELFLGAGTLLRPVHNLPMGTGSSLRINFNEPSKAEIDASTISFQNPAVGKNNFLFTIILCPSTWRTRIQIK